MLDVKPVGRPRTDAKGEYQRPANFFRVSLDPVLPEFDSVCMRFKVYPFLFDYGKSIVFITARPDDDDRYSEDAEQQFRGFKRAIWQSTLFAMQSEASPGVHCMGSMAWDHNRRGLCHAPTNEGGVATG